MNNIKVLLMDFVVCVIVGLVTAYIMLGAANWLTE